MIDSLFSGVAGLIVLLLDIWAIVSVMRSDASGARKLVWTMVILIFPVLGLIAWGFARPRGVTPPSSSEHSK